MLLFIESTDTGYFTKGKNLIDAEFNWVRKHLSLGHLIFKDKRHRSLSPLNVWKKKRFLWLNKISIWKYLYVFMVIYTMIMKERNKRPNKQQFDKSLHTNKSNKNKTTLWNIPILVNFTEIENSGNNPDYV